MGKNKTKQNDLTLVIVAKNEEVGLEKAISSCRSFVKEVIVAVDDKCSDDTLGVAKKFADKVIMHTWQDSFAEARNFVQNYAKTKWVLHLDGHEFVEEYKGLRKVLKKDYDGLFVRIRMENGFTFYFPRIIKKEVQWQHKVHNTPKTKKNLKYSDFMIVHDRVNGQAEEAKEERKKQRERMLNENLGKDAKRDKRNSRANFYMGNLCLDSSKFKKATYYYKRCGKYSKSKDQAWLARYHACICYNEIGKHLKALNQIKKAEEIMPDRWETAKMKGATYAFLGKHDESAEHLIDSFKINTTDFRFNPVIRNDAQTWDFVGLCFFQLNQMEKAKIAWSRALEINRQSMSPLLPEARIAVLKHLASEKTSPLNIDKTIELCCCVYARAERVPKILEQLKAQTVQNFKLNLWNNSGKKLDIKNFPEEKIQVIESEKNIGSQARFRLAKKTLGNPIIFFDDDEDLSPDFVEYHYKEYMKYGPKYILGWFTRTFKKESYWKSTGASYGQEVDYVATKAMVLDREIIDKEPLLQEIPEDFAKVEDLYLCYIARMKHDMKMIKIDRTTTSFVDNKDQWKNLDKEKAFSLLRKKDWWVLSDNIEKLKGLTFKVRDNEFDRQILSTELIGDSYRVPKNPKVVVDIGAHIGGTSLLCAKRGAEVFAFEPEEENFNLLVENVNKNGFSEKVHCIKNAVGNEGKRTLYSRIGNSGAGSFERQDGKKQTIGCVSIAHVFENISHCDFLKIDCEGAGYEFITEIPFEKVDQISMELHAGPQQKTIDYLKSYYNVFYKPALDRTSKMLVCYKPEIIQAKRILGELNVPCFLMNGNLLEAVRGKGKIEHNKVDSDLGIESKYQHRTSEIVEAFKENGFTENVKNHYTYKGKVRALQFRKGDHHVDLLFIYKKGENAFFCSSKRPTSPAGNKEYTSYVYSRKIFERYTNILYLEETFNIPALSKMFLKERYGKQWETPIEKWNFLDRIDNPSLRPNYKI